MDNFLHVHGLFGNSFPVIVLKYSGMTMRYLFVFLVAFAFGICEAEPLVARSADGGTSIFATESSDTSDSLGSRIRQFAPSDAGEEDESVAEEDDSGSGGSFGTGFFITDDGLLLTNDHVVDGGHNFIVYDPALKKHWKAKLLTRGGDETDYALLKINAKTIPIPIGNSGKIARGAQVMTLGYPLPENLGQAQKATFGRINALSGLNDDPTYFQIDVPIQAGNSGGPLINRFGEVVGLTSASYGEDMSQIETSGYIPQAVNYALKIEQAMPAVKKHIGTGNLGQPLPERSANWETIIQMYEGSSVMVLVDLDPDNL